MNILKIQTNNTGKPLYWANYDGGDGSGSGYFKIAPAPDVSTYTIEAEYLKMPDWFKFRKY